MNSPKIILKGVLTPVSVNCKEKLIAFLQSRKRLKLKNVDEKKEEKMAKFNLV